MQELKQNFKFYAITYGCRVNQYETQSIREWWLSLGGEETEDPCEADVILVDSCAVTAEAVADARQMARKLGRLNPKARIFAAGCAASAAPQDFAALEGVAAVIPQVQKFVLLQGHPLEMRDFSTAGGEEGAARVFAPFRISAFKRARPVIKVQDGCSQGCAYCIIPLTRGPSRSRPVDDIVAEAQRLLESGHREILLSGVNLRQFHAGSGDGKNFWALLRRLDAELAPRWAGRARFRLSSLDPAQVTGAMGTECLETLEACRMLCPQLHLSLQSGSPTVLARMGRSPYSPESIAEAVAKMRAFWPVMGLGADILMGFPGESEEETEETLAMLRALPMTYAHVFPYSERPGTRAASMPQLPKKVRQEHAARVRELIARKKTAFLREQLALPSMLAAFDSADARHGNNEFFVDCRMEEGFGPFPGHELIKVEPLRIDRNMLIVRPAR
ncbi:MiaB/RimO family radical SAM methylthiotransferase [Mailhella sp.]|uniref:MiaB/RimO family radical SAM methylthiotransferase n=1 Tax=Mailhella sp. TaxID=1981029 RepID=UPI0040633309